MSTKCTVLILAGLLLGNSAYAGNEDAASPEILISGARSLEEIRTEGMPPMLVRADLQVPNAKGVLLHGGYTLDWVSRSRWREEIRFENYERLRVRDAKGYWQKTGLSYEPEIIFELDTLLHIENVLRVNPKQTLGKLKKREKEGVREKCTEVKWAIGTEKILCFDEVRGALLSVEFPKGERQNPPEISRIEYSGFNAVGEKLVPYEIRALKDRKVVIAIRILEITKIVEEKPGMFDVPGGAEFWAQCDDMPQAELVEKTQPKYPANARANHEEGRVVLYAVIEADGSLSHMAIIHEAPPPLEAATIEAVRHWRYKPIVCGETPIRLETSIATDFWLEPY